MASLLLMNFLDVARSLGEDPLNVDPLKVEKFISQEFRRTGGTFNYNSSIKSLPGLYSGDLSVEAAKEFCMNSGSPAGRRQNAQAVEIAGSYAQTRTSRCYKTSFAAVPVGRLSSGDTAFMAIKAPLVRVENGRAYVVVPGFRLGHRPKGLQIDVASSFALATLARDAHNEADFEYLDCGRGISGERELRVYHGRSRIIFDLDAVDHLLDIYVRGLEKAIQSGMPAKAPNFQGYRVIDPDQPSMF